MALVDSLVVFLVSLTLGSIGIYIGGRTVTGTGDIGKAVLTALTGAIVWSLLAWLPFFGPILALLSWIIVINFYYSGGWVNAILIGVTSWLATIVILYLLSAGGITELDAIGIPGT